MFCRFILVSLLLSVKSFCFSQNERKDSCTLDSLTKASNVFAFIKGKEGKRSIKWKFFYKGFELKLTDSSYEIIGFCMAWDDRRKDMLVSRCSSGNIATIEIENPEINDKSVFSLRRIAPGTLFTIDRIRIRKNGVCFYVPGVAIYVTK